MAQTHTLKPASIVGTSPPVSGTFDVSRKAKIFSPAIKRVAISVVNKRMAVYSHDGVREAEQPLLAAPDVCIALGIHGAVCRRPSEPIPRLCYPAIFAVNDREESLSERDKNVVARIYEGTDSFL